MLKVLYIKVGPVTTDSILKLEHDSSVRFVGMCIDEYHAENNETFYLAEDSDEKVVQEGLAIFSQRQPDKNLQLNY